MEARSSVDPSQDAPSQEGVSRRVLLRRGAIGGLSVAMFPVLGSALSACGSSSSGSSGSAGDSKTVTLGECFQITGDEAAYGTESQRGASIAIKAVNKAGKYHFNTTLVDDQSTVQGAVLGVQKLLSNSSVNIMFGPNTNPQCDATGPAIQRVPKLQFTLNVDPNYYHVNKYGYALAASGQAQGYFGANFVKSQNWAKVGCITEDSPVGLSILAGFQEKAKALGIQIVHTVTYQVGDTSFGADVGELLDAKPDAIIISSTAYTEPALIARALRAVNKTMPLAAYDAVHNTTFLQLAGAAANGVICFDSKPANTAYRQTADALYKAAYGTLPVIPVISMAYYDAVNWLVQAFEATGTTTDVHALSNWFTRQKSLTTYFGESDFVQGRMTWPYAVFQVTNNTWGDFTS